MSKLNDYEFKIEGNGLAGNGNGFCGNGNGFSGNGGNGNGLSGNGGNGFAPISAEEFESLTKDFS
jgi:hypothetical protein